MATDNIKKTGTANIYKSDAGGATLMREPVIGIVKNNIDPTRSGKIDVYLAVQGGPDPNDSNNWIKGVRYLSPFYGLTGGGSSKTTNGEFVGNPQSYGFWASAPDIGTEVMCIFANGRPEQAYYIGCIPSPGLLQMTPAIGASANVVPNSTEATSYGGADRLPTGEVNVANPAIKRDPAITTVAKPIHSYQASILAAQGLVRDNVRGVISSSAQRESPSRVFGLSTPGGPIFEGGYTSQTIRGAAATADPAKLKQIGRTGGHTFVMDDGTLDGADQLIRLRSSAGHQITMSDSGQTLFIIHSNGQSWIEMGKEGTIDIYSTNSFNVRTQGDINFHADRDVNINAARNLNLFGETVNLESSKNTNFRVGVNFSAYTLGAYTVKVDGAMSQHAGGQASYLSSAETFVRGSRVNLNTGNAGLTPAVVPVITKTSHIDTTNSATVGWMNPSPEPLVSVTNRAPAHQPWIGSGKGVDVKVSAAPPSQAPQSASPSTTAVTSAPSAPAAPVSQAAVAAAPTALSSKVAGITPPVAQAITAQVANSAQAAAAAGNPLKNVINAVSGVTTQMAEAAGALKPGSGPQAAALIEAGMSPVKALSSAVTGVASATALVTSAVAGAGIVATNIANSATQLLNTGVTAVTDTVAKISGLVTGAVTSGVAAVTNLVNTGTTAVSGLMDSIAGGTFAAGLVDAGVAGLKSAIGGLADGILGKAAALGNSINDLANSLRSGLQNAFSSVEKSFGSLKAGVPNILGNNSATPAQQPSDTAKSSDAYAVADAEIETATDALFKAKRDYRDSQSPENAALLQQAEANLSAARQKKAQVSTQFLKSAVGGITSSVADVKTTLTSGLNALPGGAAALQSVINNSPIGAAVNNATTAISVVDSTLSSVGGLVANAGNMAGNLLSNTAAKVGDAMATVTAGLGGALDKINAGVAGVMGQLNASLGAIGAGVGGIKAAVAAVGTFDKTAIIAKTGQLLGNPKIPVPGVFSETPPTAEIQAIVSQVATLSNAVKEATAEKLKATLILADAINAGETAADQVEQLSKNLADAESKLVAAERAYTAAVTV